MYMCFANKGFGTVLVVYDLNKNLEIFRAPYQDCNLVHEMIYVSNIDSSSLETQTTLGFLVLFEKVEKKIQKLHIVKLTISQVGKKKLTKVDCIDKLLL